MRSIKQLYATNSEDEKNGKWFDYGEFGSFLLARAGGANTRFQSFAEEALRPYRHAIEANVLPDALAQSVAIKIFVETCLLNWKGVVADDGTELPFSKENATALLGDVPQLLNDLQKFSSAWGNYRAKKVEDEGKNS
jgi:hypothetical protein